MIASIAGMLLYTACDAPRNNPLDPENPGNLYRSVIGRVQTLSIPYQPVPGVEVIWRGPELMTTTDGAGHFAIQSLTPSDSWLVFGHPLYFRDSVYVSWEAGKQQQVDIFMNARPVADSLQLYSIILNRYPDLQTEQLAIRLKLSDPDGDIDTVRAVNDDLGKKYTLLYNLSTRWHETLLSLFQLQVQSLDAMIGRPFKLTAKDIFGHLVVLGSRDIERVIREEVEFISPAGNDTTGFRPVLHWRIYQPGFEFNYMVQIFTAEVTPQLVWEAGEIDPGEVSVEVTQDISAGEYFWVIWAIDRFGNRCRSKPASFVVRQQI